MFNGCSSLQNLDLNGFDTSKVTVGTKVTILDVEFDEEVTYEIVGSTEAAPDKNKISDESPVGKALIGHKKGDKVAIEVPSGTLEFKITEITR